MDGFVDGWLRAPGPLRLHLPVPADLRGGPVRLQREPTARTILDRIQHGVVRGRAGRLGRAQGVGEQRDVAFVNAIMATACSGRWPRSASSGSGGTCGRIRRPHYIEHHRPGDRHRPRDPGVLRHGVRPGQPDPHPIRGGKLRVRALHDHQRARPVQHEPRPAAGPSAAVRDGPDARRSEPDLFATPWQTFRQITFPQLLPAIVAGFLLAFTFSFDDYVITTFVSGPGSSMLPVYIFGQVKRGVTPETNAVAAMILASPSGRC